MATQYRFDLRETAEALAKAQGVKTGKWMVSVEFQLVAGIAGSGTGDARPSGIVQVQGLQLVPATPEIIASAASLVFDADESL